MKMILIYYPMALKIVRTTNYNTDTGIYDLGKQISFPRDKCYLEVLSEAKKRGALLIVKTSYVSEKRPGAWYIKGIGGSYDTIQQMLRENKKNGLYIKRSATLIQYSS